MKFFLIGEYLAKLQAERGCLSCLSCAPGQHTAKRRKKLQPVLLPVALCVRSFIHLDTRGLVA